MFTPDQEELLSRFADVSDRLFEAGVISTDSFTGEIGEFVACNHYKLCKSVRVTRGIAGVCEAGKRYQVKSKVLSSNTSTFSFNVDRLDPSSFDYLVLVYFDPLYNPVRIIRVPSDFVGSSEFRVTTSNIDQFEHVAKERICISQSSLNLLNEFAAIITQLQSSNVVRSRRIVGDIGEFYACKRLNLLLGDSKTQKGIDARHPNGLTFEIKTRRVYESGRRKSETRRLNNLTGKTADYLVVVTLDRAFKCAGMWIIPMDKLTNPKSANLRIVNNTVGTMNLVPSKIPWLRTGEPFDSFGKKPQARSRDVNH